MSDVGNVAPASLISTRAFPLRAAGWRLCTLSPSITHLLVSPMKSDVKTGVCPGAGAIVTKVEFETSATRSPMEMSP
jgi:hypothetical protein